MKKLLILLLLLPFIAFAQDPLVKWHGLIENYTPTTKPSYFNNSQNSITADNINGVGIGFNYNAYNGFQGSGWTTNATAPSDGTYFLLVVSPKVGKQIDVTQLQLAYKGNCKRMRVSYAKGSSSNFTFSNPTTQDLTGLNPNNNEVAVSFTLSGTNAHIVYGETLQIRIYGYENTNSGSTWMLRDNPNSTATASGYGPAIYGTISNYVSGAPSAVADAATTLQGQPVTVSVLANDTTGSTAITAITATTPAHGSVTINGTTNLTYTPATNFDGTDTFNYTITNSFGSSTAAVNITVTPFASPTANADTATTGKNITVTIDALANDTAGSGTISSIAVVSATHGTATVNTYKKVVFVPATGYTGTGVITYTVTNSNNKTTTGTITVTIVTPTGPTANADSATTAKNTAITLNVLSNDVLGNSALASVEISANGQHGTATVNSDHTVTYSPESNYTGTDTFKYKLHDAYGLVSEATVTVSVITPSSTGALCGSYTIGTGGDFATITAAVSHLNSYGVQCPVTFLLKNTLYDEASGESFPIIINQFTGSSLNNTVTFKPATGKNVTIKVNDITVSYNNYQATAAFKLYGADYVTFDGSNTASGTTRNLTVTNANTEGYVGRTVFWVASTAAVNGVYNGATNITIKNTIIRQGTKNQGEQFCVGVYSGSYTDSGSLNSHAIDVKVADANNANLTVKANDFVNVKQGVYINGSSTVPTTNTVVYQNDLGAETNAETIIQPACFNNVNGFEYNENQIYNLYRDTDAGNLISAGVYVTGNSKNGYILKNTMHDITRTAATGTPCFSGIALSSSEANANIVVANNFILNVTSAGSGAPEQNGYGIFLNTGGGYKIYNNTVNLKTSQTSGYAACLYVSADITGFDIKNNIFTNSQTSTAMSRRCAILISKSVSSISNATSFVLDYNNYTSADKLGYIGTGASSSTDAGYITSLPAWKSTTAKDTYSSDVIPVFASESDLHIDATNTQNTALNNTGAQLAAVTIDIDGQKRSTSTPDIGADEWGILTLPAAGSNDGIYCDSSTTYSNTLWANGTHWSNGTPSSDKDVIFNGDFTQEGNKFNACSIYVLAGATVNFTGSANVIVQHTLNIADGATFTMESSSNLLQVENDQNAGTAIIKRKSGLLKRLDYTMWTAPVIDARTTGYQSINAFSILTTPTRFYQFITSGNVYQSVANVATTKFALGKGYLIRMPNAINGTPNNAYYQGTQRIQFEGAFQGTPNNGNIKVALEYYAGADKHYNAIGNPYPSPISVRDFITQNTDVIDGTLYFWRKTNDASQTTYSAVNMEAYTANAAPGGTTTDGNNLIADPYTIDADKGVLNTAQGFIVEAKSAKEVVFRNNMRVQNNSQYFFKTTEDASAESIAAQGRVWLNATNNSGDFSQAVVAYNPATTLDYDNGYDGKVLTAANISLYSLLQTQTDSLHLIIQSRGNFSVNDAVAMGYNAAVAGDFQIAIDHTDGVFAAGQAVYLVDMLTGITKNLKEGNYTFRTEIGTFNNRFKLIYAPESELGTDTPVVDVKQMVIYRDGKQINIQAPATIKAVAVYDMLGKTLYTKSNMDTTSFSTDNIYVAQQVIIVQITLDNNQVVSKKIMMN
jgi:hypothetical protein